MDGGKTKKKDHGGVQDGKAVCPRSGSAEENLSHGLAGPSPVAMPAVDLREDWWPGADAEKGIVHLTVYARSERTAPMQPVYVVDRARGKLFVRALSEFLRPEAKRLEVALNRGVSRLGD